LSIASVLSVIGGLKQMAQDGPALLPALCVALGVILAVAFVRRQRSLGDPMLDLSLFQNRAFTVSITSNVLNVFVSFGSFILVSQYLQLVLGLAPLQAGLLSLPASVCAIAGPMLSPMLEQRLGMRSSLAGLLALTGLGFAIQSLLGGPLAAVMVAVGWALWAFGGSAAATLTTGIIISSARPERAGAVSALAQTGAELGGALGIALLGSLGTLIYRGLVAPTLPATLSPDMSAAARDTLGGALQVASQLTDPAVAANLALTAQQSLTSAVQVISAISALFSLAIAVAVLVCFERSSDCQSTAHADAVVA
jgi:DHA2 family multidrug resistance protein-like MFS transporter